MKNQNKEHLIREVAKEAKEDSGRFCLVVLGACLLTLSVPALLPPKDFLPDLFAGADSYHSSLLEKTQSDLWNQKLEIRNKSIEKDSLLRAINQRIETLIGEADAALQSGFAEKARRRGLEVLTLEPHEKRAVRFLAHLAIQDSQLGEKEDSFLQTVEEDLARRTRANQDNILKFYLRRAEYFLQARRYEEAIADLEQIFVIDPGNLKASGVMDGARKSFIKEVKARSKEEKKQAGNPLQDLFNVSLETARQLVRENRFVEAKILLNRIALLDPENKEVRKLMQKMQKEERKRG